MPTTPRAPKILMQEGDATLPAPFSHRDYEYNVHHQPKGSHTPCCLCGKACINPAGYLRVVAGGARFARPDETYTDVAADVGVWPVGSSCLRQHPGLRGYILPKKTKQVIQ